MNDGDRSIEFVYFSAGHEGGVAGEASGGLCSPWSQKGASSLNEYTDSDVQTGNVSGLADIFPLFIFSNAAQKICFFALANRYNLRIGLLPELLS